MDGEGDIRATVTAEIQQHTNHAGIVDSAAGRRIIEIPQERSTFSRSGAGGRMLAAQS